MQNYYSPIIKFVSSLSFLTCYETPGTILIGCFKVFNFLIFLLYISCAYCMQIYTPVHVFQKSWHQLNSKERRLQKQCIMGETGPSTSAHKSLVFSNFCSLMCFNFSRDTRQTSCLLKIYKFRTRVWEKKRSLILTRTGYRTYIYHTKAIVYAGFDISLTCFVIQIEPKFDDFSDIDGACEIRVVLVQNIHSDRGVSFVLLILLQIFAVKRVLIKTVLFMILGNKVDRMYNVCEGFRFSKITNIRI